MRRKVVEGGPVIFKEDMPIDEAAVSAPLGLPAASIGRNELTLLYKGRFFVLNRKPADSFAKIWGTTYGIEEDDSPKKMEDSYRAANANEITGAQREWLAKVLPSVDLPTAMQVYGDQLKSILREKVAAVYATPSRVPGHTTGAGTIAPLCEGAVLDELEGCERMLFIDGKAYELLTLAEYLSKFVKTFDPQFWKTLSSAAKTATPEAVIRLIEGNRDKVERKTAGVLKGKIHFNERSFELFLDGVYFIPEHMGATSEIIDRYNRLLEGRMKLDAVDNLLT
ncbi:MAG: hypothetical protein AB1714_11970 [Acidobacteriota bacterium]